MVTGTEQVPGRVCWGPQSGAASPALLGSWARRRWSQGPYLHAQADGIEHDEGEHEVFEVGGGDHVPHLVLVRVFGDVAPEGAGLQSVLHTLALRHDRTGQSAPQGPLPRPSLLPGLGDPAFHRPGAPVGCGGKRVPQEPITVHFQLSPHPALGPGCPEGSP